MSFRIALIIFLVFCSILSVQAVAAGDTDSQSTFSHYELPYKGYATKHEVWARPWCEGKTRMLVLLPAVGKKIDFIKPGTVQRDVVELVQRFNFECDTMMMVSSKTGLPAPGVKAQEDLRHLLRDRKYDVIVLANVQYENLRKEIQYYILKQVLDGTGLVCIKFKPLRLFGEKWAIPTPKGLVQGTGIEKTMSKFGQKPMTLPVRVDDVIQTYSIGKARGALIEYPVRAQGMLPMQSYSIENRAAYEYWSAWMGKTILWAARKLGKTEILPDKNLNCRIVAKGLKGKKLTLAVTIKNVRGEVVTKYTRQVDIDTNGEADAKLKCPDLPNGTYYAELILKDDKTVQAFACQKFNIDQNIKLGKVVLDRPFVEIGETISVKVQNPKNGADTVRIELVTADSRRIARRNEKLMGNNAEVSFKISSDMIPTTAMRVRVSLLKNGKICDTKDLPFNVTIRNRDGFKFVVWDCPWDVLGYDMLKRLRDEAGVTSILSKGTSNVLAANSVSLLMYLTRLHYSPDKTGQNKPFCWNDKRGMDKYFDKRLNYENSRLARQRGVLGWSLGDEPESIVSCKAETCVNAYRNFLKKRYKGSIAKLNRVWNEKYRNFNDVKLTKSDDLDEIAAYRKGNYPRWMDRQLFLRKTFVDVFRNFKTLIKKYDPKAIVGFEGAGTLADGLDLQGIVDTCGFWCTYDNPVFSVADHMASQNFMSTKWTGYNRPTDNLIQYTNECIMRGGDTILWWRINVRGEYEGLIRSDMEFSQRVRKFLEETKIYRQGLGDLIVKSKPVDDGIAIFYSPESILAASCGNYGKYGSASGEYREIFRILEKLGMGWRSITPQSIKKGQLTPRRVKVLILPFVAALDKKTALSIERYVRAGGTVIADVIPGVFDGYCRKKPKSILSKLFGVKYNGPLKVKKIRPCFNVNGYNIMLPSARYVSNLQSDGAKVLAKKGNFVYCNKFGRGKAILLNFSLNYYSRVRHLPMVRGLHSMFDDIFREAGVSPAITARPVNPNVAGSIGVSIWKNGQGYILGIQNRRIKPEKVKVNIPKEMKIIALRSGEVLDKEMIQKIDIPAHRVRFFAVVPELPGKPKITLPNQCTPGQSITVTITQLSKKYSNALLVELINPEGKKQLWSRKILLTTNGQAKYTWTPAYNDPAGKWTLRVVPIIGKSAIAVSTDLIESDQNND